MMGGGWVGWRASKAFSDAVECVAGEDASRSAAAASPGRPECKADLNLRTGGAPCRAAGRGRGWKGSHGLFEEQCSTMDESPRTFDTCPRSLDGFSSYPSPASRPCGYDRTCLSLRYDHQPGRQPSWRYSEYRVRYPYRPTVLHALLYDVYPALRNGRPSPRVTAYLLARRLAPSIE